MNKLPQFFKPIQVNINTSFKNLFTTQGYIINFNENK